MDKRKFAVGAIGTAVIGAVISVVQYKKACAETEAKKKELEELKRYNAQLDEIKQQIEAQKGTKDDFIYTTRRMVERANEFVKLVEN